MTQLELGDITQFKLRAESREPRVRAENIPPV